jgi:hypothetical protein
MNNQNFTYGFQSSKTPEEIFDILLHIDQWWSGQYGETIAGASHKVNDEFSFEAGGGMHYSKQRMTELVPNQRVAWEVSESKLTFLNEPAEWVGTLISFDISKARDKTNIVFTHRGLVPELECYGSCSTGWTKYLDALKSKIN